MGGWSTALFGAMKGGGSAVARISEDERKNLADRMKMQMDHDLAMLRQGQQNEFAMGQQDRLFDQQASLQDSRQSFQSGQQDKLFEHQNALADVKATSAAESAAAKEKLERDKIASAEKIASERNQAMRDIAKSKNGDKSDKDKISSMKAEDAVWKELVSTKKWKPGDPVPNEYLERINGYRELSGRSPITQEQTKEKSFFEKAMNLFGFGGESTEGQPTAAQQPVDQSWKTTPTARAALNKPPSTAPAQKNDSGNLLSSPVKSAGVPVSPQAQQPPVQQPMNRGSYTSAPSDQEKQAAMNEVVGLVKRVGSDYAKVWNAMSSGAKQLWGGYMAFADWFNNNTWRRAIDSQKGAYNETFRQ